MTTSANKSKENKHAHHTGHKEEDHNYSDKHNEHHDKNHHPLEDNKKNDNDKENYDEDNYENHKKPNPEYEHVLEKREHKHHNDTPPDPSNINHPLKK